MRVLMLPHPIDGRLADQVPNMVAGPGSRRCRILGEADCNTVIERFFLGLCRSALSRYPACSWLARVSSLMPSGRRTGVQFVAKLSQSPTAIDKEQRHQSDAANERK